MTYENGGPQYRVFDYFPHWHYQHTIDVLDNGYENIFPENWPYIPILPGESTIAHDSSDDDGPYIDHLELQLTDDESLEVEYIDRTDWDGMSDPCPECGGTEFDHMQYEGGHYGQYQDTVIERDRLLAPARQSLHRLQGLRRSPVQEPGLRRARSRRNRRIHRTNRQLRLAVGRSLSVLDRFLDISFLERFEAVSTGVTGVTRRSFLPVTAPRHLVRHGQVDAPLRYLGLAPVDERRDQLDRGLRFRPDLNDLLERVEELRSAVRVAGIILTVRSDENRLAVVGLSVRRRH